MEQSGRRVLWIDCAKGIGIVLIAIWHSPTDVINSEYMAWAKASAVPFFFFLAGFFISKNRPFKKHLYQKFKSLYIPYLTASFLAVCGSWVLSSNPISSFDFLAIIYGSFHYLEWGPIWFLPHLFLISCIGLILIKTFNNHIILFVLAVILFLFNVFLLSTIWKLSAPESWPLEFIRGWPLSADLTFISLFFYLSGFFYYKKALVKESSINRIYYFLIALSLFYLNFYFNSYVMDLAQRQYDHFLWSTISAFSGIYFLLVVSRFVGSFNGLGDFLAFIGQNSLVILIFHEVTQRRVFNYLENYTDQYISGILAFLVCILVPIIFNYFIFSRSIILAALFNSEYKPLTLGKRLSPNS